MTFYGNRRAVPRLYNDDLVIYSCGGSDLTGMSHDVLRVLAMNAAVFQDFRNYPPNRQTSP